MVIWGQQGDPDWDVLGYDLKQKRRVVISRYLGDQSEPKIDGQTDVWVDGRRSGLGKYDYQPEIYGAHLAPTPAPLPATGALTAADAKIESVWPKAGLPGTQASITGFLLMPGMLVPGPCQWEPRAHLWMAVNNDPARLVATAARGSRYVSIGTDSQAFPSWDFNDVSVAAARDPKNRLYFFMTVEGVPSRTNVWAHAADARTVFPEADKVAGTGPVGDSVDAKVETVAPHDSTPSPQISRVNVTAMLFKPGTGCISGLR